MFRVIPLALLFGSLTIVVGADEPRPLKVLWCTGGGSHDYKGLTPLLTKSIQKYARAEFDVSWDYKAWAKKGFADKYDAIVQFHTVHDKDLAVSKAITDNIATTIHAGKPALDHPRSASFLSRIERGSRPLLRSHRPDLHCPR